MKLVRALALVMLLTAILVTPAIAAPVSQGTTLEELTPIAAYLFLTTFFIPPIIAGMRRFWFGKWEEAWRKDVAVFVLCLLAGLGEVFFNGSLILADGDPRQIANVIVVNMALTVGAAFVWYKMFWKPSTIDDRISGVQ